MASEEEKGKAVVTATTLAGLGATAGVGIASVLCAPLLIPALIGGAIGCVGGVIISVTKKKREPNLTLTNFTQQADCWN